MSTKYPGGYITKSPPQPSFFTAPGVWTLDQAAQYIKAGEWPSPPGSPQYAMVWGTNMYGSFGIDSSYNYGGGGKLSKMPWTLPAQSLFPNPIKQRRGGGTSSMFLAQDGSLWFVGQDQYLLFVQPDSIVDVGNFFYPVPILISSDDWSTSKISYTSEIFLAVKPDGTLWGWGDGSGGVLGTGNGARYSSPVQIGSDTDWYDVAQSSSSASFALKTNGTLWSWGSNSVGQLGQNIASTVARSSPVQIGALTNWAKIFSVQGNSMYAIKTDGTLWAWGENAAGQLGINNRVNRSSPVQVGALTNWGKVCAPFSDRTFFLTTSGVMYGVGTNTSGSLGIGNVVNRSSPVQIGSESWLEVSNRIDGNSVAAIRADGTLWGWGVQSSGNVPVGLTNGTTTTTSSPVQIGSALWDDIGFKAYQGYNTGKGIVGTTAWFGYQQGTYGPYGTIASNPGWGEVIPPVNISTKSPFPLGSTKWKSISSGALASAGIKEDGTLWAWGYNNKGVLGQDDIVSRSSPVQIGSDTWKYATIGSVLAAIKTDGTLWTSGSAYVNGTSSTVDRSSPVQVGSSTGWTVVKSCGQLTASVTGSVIALNNGSLYTWGYNFSGELGRNNRTDRASPGAAIGGDTWTDVSIGGYNTGTSSRASAAAIRDDGTLWTWGSNASGQLGHRNRTVRSSPVQVGTLTNWKKVWVGDEYMFAVKTDGTLWAWGLNGLGQLGDGTTINRSSPVQIGSDTNWTGAAPGGSTSAAIALLVKSDGSLYVTGRITPWAGEYGNYSLTSSPVQIGAGITTTFESFNNAATSNVPYALTSYVDYSSS